MIRKEITGAEGIVGYLLLDEIDADIADKAINLVGRKRPAPYASETYPVFKQYGQKVRVHREVARRMGLVPMRARELSDNTVIDHKNGDRFDCRRENLRKTTDRNNTKSRWKPRANSKSGLKGVSWEKPSWVVYVITDGARLRVGKFKDKYDAARAYDAKALELHGEFAVTNAMLGLYPEQGE